MYHNTKCSLKLSSLKCMPKLLIDDIFFMLGWHVFQLSVPWVPQLNPLYSLTNTKISWERNLTTKEITTIFPLWTFYLNVGIIHHNTHMEYISNNIVLQSLYFLSWFPWYRVDDANKVATETRVACDKVETITNQMSLVLWSPSWLG